MPKTRQRQHTANGIEVRDKAMNTFIRSVRSVALAACVATAAMSGTALAAGDGPSIDKQSWSFAGPFGRFDRAQLQRGFQIYKEVCASCHSMNLIAFRNLMDKGGPEYTEDQAKAIAAEYEVQDGPNEDGEMFTRKAKLSDYFPAVYANPEEAKVANGGAVPPDFSLLAKARAAKRGFPNFVFDVFTMYQENGPDYIYALMTNYKDAPEGVTVGEGLYYNDKFLSGHAIAMPPQLSDDQIDYAQNQDDDPNNDVPQTVQQYARDIAAFMYWAAEPKMEERKRIGFMSMLFLIIFATMLYLTKRKVWRNVEH